VRSATLTVTEGNGSQISDTYPVIIQDQSLDVEVNVAVDEGLWFLHKQQSSSGDWSSYGGQQTSAISSSLQAFVINGHRPLGDPSADPYVVTVRRGFDALFARLRPVSIGMQPYGDPDSNGNGIGIEVVDGFPPYQGGMVMDAIAASGAPDRIVTTGPGGVVGRTYRDIVQDMIDMYAWGQYDGGLGGWRYNWQDFPDNSACQWGAIGFLGARHGFGLDTPAWVKDQNALWINYSGYYGYTGAGSGDATTPWWSSSRGLECRRQTNDGLWPKTGSRPPAAGSIGGTPTMCTLGIRSPSPCGWPFLRPSPTWPALET
jgi:hypothetical protein